MRLRIGDSVLAGEGGRAADLTGDFADWLTSHRDVSRYAEIRRLRPPAADGAMSGELVEWIGLTLSSGFSAAALVYAHLSFRASLPPGQRPGARMVIEHNGVRVVVDEGTAEDVARIARALAAPRPECSAGGSPSAGAGGGGCAGS
ncbi:hypothetical protein [Streptomyces sp. B6B3]|uniref:effector-associated constant component EACC1 n=1 Tax=Streptomyces sp. B6B3 TaxID=3153570 RepID=UPI00325CC1F6